MEKKKEMWEMEVIINRKELLKAIEKIKLIVSNEHLLQTIPVLASVFIEAKNNAIEIIATDLEISFKGIYPAKVLTSGCMLMPVKEIFSFISKSKKDEISIKMKEKDCVTISDGDTFFDIFCMGKDEFPLLPVSPELEDTPIEIDAFVFKNMIIKTIVPMNGSTEESPNYVAGSLFKVVKKGKKSFLHVVGTNRVTLVKESKEVFVSKGIDTDCMMKDDGVLISKQILIMLNKLLLRNVRQKRKSKGIGFDLYTNNILMGAKHGFIVIKKKKAKRNEIVIVKLLVGKFPDYHPIVADREDMFPIIAKRELLLDSMKQLSNMVDWLDLIIETNIIRMRFVDFDWESRKKKEIRRDILVQYNGDRIEVRCYPKQFVDFLRLMESDFVRLDFADTKGHCFITGEKDKGLLFVIRFLFRTIKELKM